MKKILSLLCLIFCLSCNQKTTKSESSEVKEVSSQSENLDWLIGNWKRTNEELGKETFENWKKLSPQEYAGQGFTLQQGDTISQETMNILLEDSKWSLHVKTADEKEATTFNLTDLKSNSFTFSNDSIDFPKNIKYWMEGKIMKAVISNEKFEIPFDFEKLK